MLHITEITGELDRAAIDLCVHRECRVLFRGFDQQLLEMDNLCLGTRLFNLCQLEIIDADFMNDGMQRQAIDLTSLLDFILNFDFFFRIFRFKSPVADTLLVGFSQHLGWPDHQPESGGAEQHIQ